MTFRLHVEQFPAHPVQVRHPVGAKGQIVIPVEARKELELEEGDKVEILRGRTSKTLILLTHPEMDRLIGKMGITDDGM